MSLPIADLSRAANEARGLAMDAVHKCSSGHLGLPLGCAEIGAVLFGNSLRFHPEEPRWHNRDRFVLSAGHGSMFLYAWLHISGYPKMTIEEIANFRQLDACTPGHPESFETSGVECTTGPLGQGVGNSVGMAVSQKMAAARYNTAEHTIFENHIICLAGDGCLQEGVAMEAVSFAGHNRLDNLILIYDANGVTLDAMADKTQSEDDEKKFEAMGWNVQVIDGNNMQAFEHAFDAAKISKGKPQIIIAKTIIGKGIPEVAGTSKAHGEGGAKFVDEAKKGLGLPADKHFYVSPETQAFFAERKKEKIADYEKWQQTFQAWEKANPELAKELANSISLKAPEGLLDLIPEFPADAKIATRKAGSDVLQPLAKAMPNFISGAADLYGSTLNYIAGGGDFEPQSPGGRNIRFGIREHAMCAMLNGFAYDKIFRPSGATFLVFADYCRPAIRLACLSHLPVVYIFTHDSVGVGEDGPTHQPIETVSGLRLIPHLHVIRPADPEETAGAFVAALERVDGPTLLALSRQNLPNLTQIPVKTRREGAALGGYVAIKEEGELKTILIGVGSELQLAVEAAKELGAGTRVVSMPCMERFNGQTEEYRESVLPSSCRRRVAVEAGVKETWYRYVGLDGAVVALTTFGVSGPGPKVMEKLGITAKAVVEAAKKLK